MSDNLHNIAPFVSAEEGWENMQGLLNLHLPVNGSKKKRPVLFSVTACILCFVFAFISYKLDNGISPIRPRQAAMFADNQNIQSLVKTTSYSSNSQMAFGNRTTISTKNI